MFGDNDKFDFKATKFYIAVYLGITVFLNIMVLNLLVCIISNSFERIQNTEKSEDIKQRIEMLTEIEVLMFYNRNKGEPMFLHNITYSDGEEGGAGDVWEGKMRQITNKCDSVIEHLRHNRLLNKMVNNQLNIANANIE